MLIPDLLNILFDQSDYGSLLVLRVLHRRKTAYARKYSLLDHYYRKDELLSTICIVGQIKAIKCIIDKVDVHAGDENMLHWSLSNLELFKYLVTVGADIHAACEYALRCCAEFGHVEIFKYLVSIGANFNTCGRYGHSALRYSATGGCLEITKYLVSIGADIHIDNEDPLIFGIDNNHLDTVKYLVSIGANVNGDQSRNALYRSVKCGNFDIAKYLVNVGANISVHVLRICIEKNYVKMLKYLIDSGANIHALDNFALRKSAYEGRMKMVKHLVNAGANIRACDDYALRWSKTNGHFLIHKYLMSKINDNM